MGARGRVCAGHGAARIGADGRERLGLVANCYQNCYQLPLTRGARPLDGRAPRTLPGASRLCGDYRPEQRAPGPGVPRRRSTLPLPRLTCPVEDPGAEA